MEPEKQPTILVAEDNESNFFLVQTLLKRNYRIIHAHDGLEALQIYKNILPDAILMDIQMPNMDGLTATRLIREIDREIPIIAVSAYAYEQDKQAALQCGCNAYIMKPVDLKLLRDTLSVLLASKKLT